MASSAAVDLPPLVVHRHPDHLADRWSPPLFLRRIQAQFGEDALHRDLVADIRDDLQPSDGPCWPIDTTYFIDEFHGLDRQFLFRTLQSLTLSELDTSSAIPGLNRQHVYSKVLPVPPLAEQKRVEELLAGVNVARERLGRVPAILKRFRQAVLAAACSGRLTEDWRQEHAHGNAEPSTPR